MSTRQPVFLAALAVLGGALPAQGAPAPSKRSLADGLVRQLIERQRLQPTRGESGDDLGAGKGPLALLVRARDGSLTVLALKRGYGDLGEAAEMPMIDGLQEEIIEEEIVEEEVVEEVELTEVPGQRGPEQVHPAPGRGEPAAGAPAAEKPAAPKRAVAVHVTRQDGVVTIDARDGSPPLRGAVIDRRAARALMERLFALTEGGPFAGQLTLELQPHVPMQDVLIVWEVARQAGFVLPLFGGGAFARGGLQDAAQQQVIRGLVEQLGWPVQRIGPMAVTDGELLVLLDGEAQWRDVAPMLWDFAAAGIWQFGFVVQSDAGQRFKLRTNLPVDGPRPVDPAKAGGGK